MKTAYIAICYHCNQRCRFCPCSREETGYPPIPLETLKDTVERFIRESGIGAIVVSGGEPTLHPQLPEFLAFLREKHLGVTVLTNAERFADPVFAGRIAEQVDGSAFMVTTTLHSQRKEEHEWVNQTPGSFGRSIRGLKNLMDMGLKVTVKHCINRQNEKELKAFYQFIGREFPEQADIQLCSIDYCRLSGEEREEQMVSFPQAAPYFEEMFDAYMEDRRGGSRRRLYCINMPLCAADPYYWDLFMKRSAGYEDYASPGKEGETSVTGHVEETVGTFGEACQGCIAREICAGTYRTAFAYYGDRIVRAYTE